MQLADLIVVLESLAPPHLAESWDNTGLLLGETTADVTRVLTCLTLTPDVAQEAVSAGAQLVVSHHPLMFKPIQRITTATAEGRTLWNLAIHGIAVYSPHTAWDSAPQGINQQIADLLELKDITPLRRMPSPAQFKLITSLPASNLEAVQQALWQAGCGVIGDYRNCSFTFPGTGTFQGSAASHPTIGTAGNFEQVEEIRLEIVCPRTRLAAALSALRTAHVYEEPAIDVIPLESLPGASGAGRAGTLSAPCTLRELVAQVRALLSATSLQIVGDPDSPLTRVGIACGSAAEFWKDARAAGCQVLLTGEARFHTGLEVRDAGMSLIVAGHYATERFAMTRLAELLTEACPSLIATTSAVEHDPFW